MSDDREPIRALQAPVRDRLCRVGSGTSRGRSAPRIVTALEPETRRILVRNPWNTEFAGRVAFLDLGGRQTAWTGDRTEFLGRNGALDRPAGLDRGYRLPGRRRRRHGSVRRPADQLRARRRSADPGPRPARRGGRGHGSGRPDPARANGRPRGALQRRARLLGRALGTVQVQRPTARWTSCSTAGSSTRRWLPPVGEDRRSTRPAAPTASATSCRTSWPWSIAEPGLRPRTSPARGRSPVPRRRRPALVAPAARAGESAPASPTTRLWLPYAVDRYLAVTGDATVLDEPVRSSKVRRSRPDEMRLLLPADVTDRVRHAVRALRGGLDREPRASARTGCRSWDGRLERRHEPRRPRGQGRERLARLVPAHRPGAPSRRSREAPRRASARAERWRAHMKALAARRSSATAGTATGTAAPTSTMAPRSARPRTPSAGSTRSPSPGASSRAPPIRPRAQRAMAAVERVPRPARRRSRPALHPAVRPCQRRPRLHQGLPARHPRERRPVHPRGHLGGARLRGAGRWRQGGRAVLAS